MGGCEKGSVVVVWSVGSVVARVVRRGNIFLSLRESERERLVRMMGSAVISTS